jgi:diguanylate cyclase (GGDEF)-like protein
VWQGERERLGGMDSRPLHPGPVLAIALLIALTMAFIAVAVISAAGRADEVALHQQRQLLLDSLAERRLRAVLEAENVATSNPAVEHLWQDFDPQWAHQNIGLRFKTLFGADYVFLVDGSDRFAYALGGKESVDPGSFGRALEVLSPAIDSVRGRRMPETADELEPTNVDQSDLRRPTRAARLQAFLGRPAIVAAVVVSPEDAAFAVPRGSPPVLITVSALDAKFLRQLGARLEMPDLHMAESAEAAGTLALGSEDGEVFGRFAWTPRQPGAELLRRVGPFLGFSFACLLLLTGFVLRYVRRTRAAIAAGEDRLRQLALHDPLSGLPNRTYFSERLSALIESVRRADASAAVLSIDLDRFKDVNDTLGHLVGDELIGAVAQRLIGVLRGDDVVARLGGDEFAVLTFNVSSQTALQALGERIIEAMRAPYSILGHTLATGASIGMALVEPHSGEAADIMRCVDVALYRAKNEGRNRACMYDAAMDADLRQRKQLEQDLREAIEAGGLGLAFQPIVNPSGERVIAVEALCRWEHPGRGAIEPAEFIPIAEHSELVIPLGEWVLRQACREAGAWPGVLLAVNVSPLQFRRPDFVQTVERILDETGFESSRLELELTESTLLGNVEEAQAAMRKLRARGVRFALDDFGTGYSSLLYLRTFPFHKLKIDRSFIGNIEGAVDAASIVHAIVSLGRGLGMQVTAEGVETAEQHLFLRAAGVHSLQGFRFGVPVPATAISERLARQAETKPPKGAELAALVRLMQASQPRPRARSG